MYINICRERVCVGIGPRILEGSGVGDSVETNPERPRLTRDVRCLRNGVVARSPVWIGFME